ncbi:tetratricopeptide repeat protein [Deinococcus lacus]|uniref:Tetratricopeptide repeat protein n=1 Tax=Deinococcus lacus TaxID=392561 RepID=A0ABW1Y9C7_9DEIO
MSGPLLHLSRSCSARAQFRPSPVLLVGVGARLPAPLPAPAAQGQDALFSAATPTLKLSSVQPSSRPTSPAANYVAVGVFYYEQGDYPKAFVAYQTAAELNPTNRDALLGLGRAQIKLRDYPAAAITLRRLLVLDNRNISAYIALSQSSQAQAQQRTGPERAALLTEALNLLGQAERMAGALGQPARDEELSKVWNERGYVYRLQGDRRAAIDAFTQASRLNPRNGVILYNLGETYSLQGDLPRAVQTLQKAVLADPRDAYSRAYYARLLAQSGDLALARPQAALAARLSPRSAYALGQYGVVSYLAREPLTARTNLTEALRLDPINYPDFYYYLGRLDLDGGDLRAARENLTRASALSRSADAAYYLGLSYERSAAGAPADTGKAGENYRRALQFDPQHGPAQSGLQRLGLRP